MLYTFSYPIHFVSMYWHSFFFTLCRFQFRISDHSRISGLVFFFGGGGQDGPTTTTTPGHGNRWVHCMVPWRPMSRMPCCNPVRVGARWAGGSLGRKGWPGWRKGCWIIECHELEGLQQIGWVWRWIFQDQLCYFGDFLRFFCDSCGKGIMRDLLRKIDASRV